MQVTKEVRASDNERRLREALDSAPAMWERLLVAMDPVAFNVVVPAIGPDETTKKKRRKMAKKRLAAVLAELERPSEAMIKAGEDDGGHSVYRWAAMVKAIRGGA